uniref:FHA domain-containing protein n=1 Tax=Salix viminalis TaxID=40686 RepID=A0A6N2N1V3_SALVM
MVQGPREGETLEFRPRSTVRIGRVVRGNNVTIKDAGVSSKHLVIVSESGKWSLQDLDSSNGTTLNSSILSPYKSFDIRDGDTIKLGESTSILVQFNVHEETSQLRRNPRRRVVANRSRRGIEEEKEYAENLEEENVEKFEVESELIVPESRVKGRPRRAKVMEKELDSVVPAEAKRVNLRSTRSRKNEDCVVLENLEAGCGELGKKVRGGRGRKNNLQEVPAENVQCDVVDVKEKVDLGINVQEEVKEIANEVKVETVEDVHEEITEKEMDLGEKCNDTAKGNGTKEDDASEAPVGANESSEKGKELPDLEKMTLEEWFDSMEVDLPKQILEVTEEIVEGMRRKAERVREYMIEQKKKQGVGNVG